MKIAKKAISLIIVSGILAASTAFAGSNPQLYRLSKYRGFVGEKVKITGINFGGEQGKVMFDDWTKAEIVSWSKKKIIIRVPDVAVTKAHKVRVCKRYDDCARSQKFFVKRSGPELWKIKNLSGSKNYQGKPGDTLKLTGQNFGSKNISVLFGDTPGRITSRTKKWIKVVVPELERDKTYAVKVTNGYPDSNTQDFYITP
ncbi:MAG: IPT/TIG domain-containing protein [Candidatus Moraniibacteriota bacterium]